MVASAMNFRAIALAWLLYTAGTQGEPSAEPKAYLSPNEDASSMESSSTSSSSSSSTTCDAYREKIQRYQTLLAEKEQAVQACHHETSPPPDDNNQAHAALQRELQTLHHTIEKLRQQKDLAITDCTRRVDESFAQGQYTAEMQYQSQLQACQDEEGLRLASALNKIRAQQAVLGSQSAVVDCSVEQMDDSIRVNSPTTPTVEALQRRLSAATTVYRAQLDYLVTETKRLTTENQQQRQSLVRCQERLLQVQAEKLLLADASGWPRIAAPDWWYNSRLVDSLSSVWKFCVTQMTNLLVSLWKWFLDTLRIRPVWDTCSRKLAQMPRLSRWKDRFDAVVKTCAIQGPLIGGLLVDVGKTLLLEMTLLIQDAPETLPRAVRDAWVSWTWMRANVAQAVTATSSFVWESILSDQVEKVSQEAMAMRQRVMTYRAKMDPQFRHVQEKADLMGKALGSLANRTMEAWLSFSHIVSESTTKSMAQIQSWSTMAEARVKLFALEFGQLARTLSLFLRVYDAPQVILDGLDYCHEQPTAALFKILLATLCAMVLPVISGPAFAQIWRGSAPRKVKFTLKT